MNERLRQIDRMRDRLCSRPYRGYDVLIVSSSTEDEAAYQQERLEAAFRGVETECSATGAEVLVVSVVDPCEGGQLIGQVFTWRQARERLRGTGLDLDHHVGAGDLRVAIYHNGGKGERASPLTQGLGNSRGAQRLVGTVRTADGSELELELLLAVVLQTASLAPPPGTPTVDTFWTSQLIFDSRPAPEASSSGFSLEKYVVEVDPATVTARELHDFGTALLRPDGGVLRFYGNKQFGRRSPDGSWEIVEERRSDWDRPDARLGFDFGSFRTRSDLHLALVEFYDRPELWERVEREGRVAREDARDIDPHLTQPLVTLLGGLPEPEAIAVLPPAAQLREATAGQPTATRSRRLAPAVDALRACLPETTRTELAAARPEGVRDALELWLLHRDRAFLAEPLRVIGSIRFGPGSLWLTFRRPIDIANDKLRMLTDVGGEQLTLQPDGVLSRDPDPGPELSTAAELRRIRGIPDDELAVFRARRRTVRLDREQVREGVEVDGVYVRNSVIRGDCRLHPGSRVVDSVLHHVSGRIRAAGSYLESVVAPEVDSNASLLHKTISSSPLAADGEIVSDAYREGLADAGCPAGQTRMRVPLGYDPQERVPAPEGGAVARRDAITRTEGGGYTLAEIREWPSRRRRNDAIEEALRARALAEGTG